MPGAVIFTMSHPTKALRFESFQALNAHADEIKSTIKPKSVTDLLKCARGGPQR